MDGATHIGGRTTIVLDDATNGRLNTVNDNVAVTKDGGEISYVSNAASC